MSGIGQVLDALGDARHVLIAGAGGGHDVYSGIPLWWHLRDAGVRVSWASLSFTDAGAMPGPAVDSAGALFAVTPEVTLIGEVFASIAFAELHLARWLEGAGVDQPVVWSIPSAGLVSLRSAYRWMAEHLGFDAVVLVDGGNDSLMRGTEHGLGTVAEDGVSMIAASELDVPTKLLLCAGLGTDARHGVGLADTFASIAELTSRGAWRGACALIQADPGVNAMCAAIEIATRAQQYPSTVANAVVAAVDGRFGHLETGSRGGGDSSVWVNPLMAMYWAFDLDAVVDRLAYAAALEDTVTSRDAIHNIIEWRRTITPAAPNRIPL